MRLIEKQEGEFTAKIQGEPATATPGESATATATEPRIEADGSHA